jgi:deoxyribonuclease V
MLKVWPRDPERLAEEQRRLAAATPPPWRYRPGARVGGCFVCFTEDAAERRAGAERAWAAAVTYADGRRVAAAVVAVETDADYRPGMLALRAGPALEAAVRALTVAPEVLLVNATGRDHPRGAGLALHLGAVLGVPTVGVTDRALEAEAAPSDGEPRAADGLQTLTIAGRPVAARWRPRPGVRPLCLHPAWRTDLDAAVLVVGAVTGAARTPQPVREARRLARSARAAAKGATPYPPDAPPCR